MELTVIFTSRNLYWIEFFETLKPRNLVWSPIGKAVYCIKNIKLKDINWSVFSFTLVFEMQIIILFSRLTQILLQPIYRVIQKKVYKLSQPITLVPVFFLYKIFRYIYQYIKKYAEKIVIIYSEKSLNSDDFIWKIALLTTFLPITCILVAVGPGIVSQWNLFSYFYSLFSKFYI